MISELYKTDDWLKFWLIPNIIQKGSRKKSKDFPNGISICNSSLYSSAV